MTPLKSRHASIAGKLTRSYGIDTETGDDLVVELRPGVIELRREPLGRRLRRNEVLPSNEIDVREAMDKLEADAQPDVGQYEKVLAKLHTRICVTDFGQVCPKEIAYKVKSLVASALAEIIQDSKK